MRTFLLASALALAAAAPASAQMMGMGMGDGGMARSCVSGGQFVPCGPGGGMAPGMAGAQPGMAQGQPGMAQGEMMEERRPARRAKRKRMARGM